MDDYITATEDQNVLVIRTADWVVVARCTSQTFANLIAVALNA